MIHACDVTRLRLSYFASLHPLCRWIFVPTPVRRTRRAIYQMREQTYYVVCWGKIKNARNVVDLLFGVITWIKMRQSQSLARITRIIIWFWMIGLRRIFQKFLFSTGPYDESFIYIFFFKEFFFSVKNIFTIHTFHIFKYISLLNKKFFFSKWRRFYDGAHFLQFFGKSEMKKNSTFSQSV